MNLRFLMPFIVFALIFTSCKKEELPTACIDYQTIDTINGGIQFTNCSENASNYFWDFGDGNTSTEIEPLHQFELVFPYNIMLIVSNNFGNDTLFMSLTEEQLNLKPRAKFSYTLEGDNFKTVLFANTSINATQFKWSFGDEAESIERNPVHNYSEYKTYHITLTASNAISTNIYEKSIEVIDSINVAPDFYYNVNEYNYKGISFMNTTAWGKEYLWDFGDGTTSTIKEPYHEFPNFQTYTVKLTASNNYTSKTVSKKVSILDPQHTVTVNFAFEEVPDSPNTYNFINLSEGANNYLWNFNNEGTSTEENPSFTFNSENQNLIIVSLEAWNEFGGYGNVEMCVSPDCYLVAKPNIYLYPETPAQIQLKIQFPLGGQITNSAPEYYTGWNVFVESNGRINHQYDYLFYESNQISHFQKEQGWCIAKSELETFFRSNMTQYGFNEKEIEDFVRYWIPRLNYSQYFNIYPQTNSIIDEAIELKFSEQPDNILRLFYGISPADHLEIIQAPSVPKFKREGFVVTEWGVFQ